MVISDQDLVTLDETQRRYDVPFGSSLTLNCSWNTKNYNRFRVAWYFNPFGSSFSEANRLLEKIFDRHKNTTTVVYNKKQDLKGDGKDTEETVLKYTLSNVTFRDDGWYFCRITVEIPIFINNSSNGTKLTISKYYI